MKPSDVIASYLDTTRIAGLGCFSTVAQNVADQDVERGLTYLLGVQDAFGASGNSVMANLVRDCRTALKDRFRNGVVPTT